MGLRARILLGGALVSACTAAPGEPAGRTFAALARGTPSDEPAVLWVHGLDGTACAATAVSPRVLVTARRCFGDGERAAERHRIYPGPSLDALGPALAIDEVRTEGHCWEDCPRLTDVAVVILAEPLATPTVPIGWAADPVEVGELARVVGYGVDVAYRTGAKRSMTVPVLETGERYVVTAPSLCQGDVGAPLLRLDGALLAVGSHVADPDDDPETPVLCGDGNAVFNRLSPFRALIEDAIRDSNGCVADGAERCNGVDDDCDGIVDGGCLPAGRVCARDDECVGGQCVAVDGERLCAPPCDVTARNACEVGFRCMGEGRACGGACVPAGRSVAGERALACAFDANGCAEDEACSATRYGECGTCGPASAPVVAGERGFNEPCVRDDDCRGRFCASDGFDRYCSRRCTDDGDCRAGFHCRSATCVRGPRGELGARCGTSEDCSSALFCAWEGEQRWCTRRCEAGCPVGHACVAAVGGERICRPLGPLPGAPCAADDACGQGLCVDGRCAARCALGVPCGPGAPCERLEGARALACTTHGPSEQGGLCSAPGAVGAPSGAVSTATAACLAALLGAIKRAARRRRRAPG